MDKLVSILSLACVFLGLAPAAWAQATLADILGTVRDPSGAAVSGAEVRVRNLSTNVARDTTTNAEGVFRVPNLPPGAYEVSVSRSGFSRYVQGPITLRVGQDVELNIRLEVAGLTEVITVTSDAGMINTTNAEIKQSLSSQEVLDRPTFNQGYNGFLSLAETFTGFQENPTSGQNNPTLSSGSSINFNGTGTRGATFQINGVNNDDSSENQNRQGVSLSTIKEFQVITNNFSAEFGRGYGAVVLVQTKSGTNRVSGDLYLYHNDSALNAALNVFSPGAKKPVNRRNQYGFTLGFPFIKNKLFGFVSFDEVRNSGAGSYTRDLLLAQERDGSLLFKVTPANVDDGQTLKEVLDRANTGARLLADRGYDAQTNRQLLQAHGLRDGIARRAKPGQERRVRLDARNKAINRVRARGEHVFAGLEQLGGKCVRAMTLARNELAILLKCAAYNAKRLVWLVRHDPCGCAR